MPTWIRHTASTLTLLAMAVQASAYAQPSQPPKRTSAQAQQAAAKNQRSAAPSKRAAAKPAAPVAPRALRDGQAEARLLKVYQLASEGRGREALAQAESLAREHPNFQLAQLAVGDLLAARVRPVKQLGDVPEPPLPLSLIHI